MAHPDLTDHRTAASAPGGTVAGNSRAKSVRVLRELIAALDRRVPHVERVGEASIAQAAAVLKSEALKRIEELERDSPAGPVSRGVVLGGSHD